MRYTDRVLNLTNARLEFRNQDLYITFLRYVSERHSLLLKNSPSLISKNMTLLRRIRISTLDSYLGQMYVHASGLSYSWKRWCSTLPQEERISKTDFESITKDAGIRLNSRRKQILHHILTSTSSVTSMLSDVSNHTNINWKDLKEVTDQIAPAMYDQILVIDLCYIFKNYDAAISYVKYLRKERQTLNLALQGRYLYSYFLRMTPLTPSEEQDIFDTYDELRNNYKYLDVVTMKYVILALTLTSKWKESLSLYESLTESERSVVIFNALAKAAFKNGKPEIGFDMLLKAIPTNTVPCESVYTTHLNYYSKYQEKDLVFAIEEVFHFWATNQYSPHKCELEVYTDALKNLGWQTHYTDVTEMGQCQSCKQYMKPLILQQTEFEQLRNAVMEEIVIGEDIYRTTNPKELLKFKQFIDNIKPYDIVIDGLNLLYIGCRKKKAEMYCILDRFVSRGKKILFLTRHHARNTLKYYHKRDRVRLYSLSNETQDDVYILYATFANGPNTMFISADLMRQHKFVLKNEDLRRTFKTWQLTHQYRLEPQSISTSNSISDIIRCPLKYVRYAQKSGGVWHISWIPDTARYDSYDDPLWVCLVPPHEAPSPLNL